MTRVADVNSFFTLLNTLVVKSLLVLCLLLGYRVDVMMKVQEPSRIFFFFSI